MKKFLLRITTCLLTFLCLLAFASCNLFSLNFEIESVKQNLKNSGYTVKVEKISYSSSIFNPPDYHGVDTRISAISEFGEENITILDFEKSSVAKKYYEMKTAALDEQINRLEKEKAYYNALLTHHKNDLSPSNISSFKDKIHHYNNQLEECKEELENFGHLGQYVWFGTSRAIQDGQLPTI